MSLEIGNWNLNVAGVRGALNVHSVDAAGQIKLSMGLGPFGGLAGEGSWDEAAARVILIVGGARGPMLLEGYLAKTPSTAAPGEDFESTLVGVASVPTDNEMLRLLGGNRRRNSFGWSATMKVIS